MKPKLVSIVQLTDYNPSVLSESLKQLLAPLGGFEKFISAGDNVVLKPNFLKPSSAEKPACTHPAFIKAVAKLTAEQANGPITITDSPGIGTARSNAGKLGLEDNSYLTIKDADDGVLVPAEKTQYKKLIVSKMIQDADVLINLPKAKTHGQMVLTAAVKNMFGAVVGLEKAQWHFRSGKNPTTFAELIVHIHEICKPKLNILDAVIGMEGNGPGSGDPRQLGIIMASTDAYALDKVLCEILEIDPRTVFPLAVADKLGLAPDFDDIEIHGPSLSTLKPNPKWKPARPQFVRKIVGPNFLIPLFDRLLSMRPKINHAICTQCALCKKVCAAKAIELTETTTPVQIDLKKCISCFCCQEVCPPGAIKAQTGPLTRLLGLGKVD